MVSGVAKRAVILQPGDKGPFEQAIFIMSPPGAGEGVASAEELLEMADAIVADHMVATVRTPGRSPLLYCLLSFGLGAAAGAMAWWLIPLLPL